MALKESTMRQIQRMLVQTPVRMEKGMLIDLKQRALYRNITLNRWLLQAIIDKMIKEDRAA